MTAGLLSKGGLARGGGQAVVNETWVRPADWLPMPTITPGEQKVCMLVAVWNGNNYMRIAPTGTAYTVDWGDGSAPENFAVNVPADHNFSWAGCAGTLTSLGYRQAMVTITPQGAGTFGALDMQAQRHPSAAAQSSSGILAFEASMPNSILPVMGSPSAQQVNRYMQYFKMWSSVTAGAWDYQLRGCSGLLVVEGLELSAPTSLNSTFSGCSSLIHGPAMNTANVTSWTYTFNGCSRMVGIGTYDWSAATTVSNVFNACAALRSVGAVNTGNCTDFTSAFNTCSSLTSIASLDTTSALTLNSTFKDCKSLVTFPTLNTPANLNCTDTFNGCLSMASAPAMDTSKVTTMLRMFSACTALTTVPTYVTALVTDMASMFSGCSSLRTAPPFADTTKVTTMNGMFASCGALQACPAYNLTACVSTSSMFTGCASLVSATALTNTSLVTTINQMFQSASSLQAVSLDLTSCTITPNAFLGTVLRSAVLTGLRFGISVSGNLLDAAALDALYTSLGTSAGAQVINVTGNPGTTGDTPSIATGKGWTVTGS